MLFLGKEEIEKLTDPQEMMDQIEEAYRILAQMNIICRRVR